MDKIKQFCQQSPVTAAVLLLSCFISLITGFGSFLTPLSWFIFEPNAVLHGQIWRLWTPMFLHFPTMGIVIAHLAFNMVWWCLFATVVERKDGSRFLLWLLLLSGLLTTLCQGFFSGAFNHLVVFGGMSGVVYTLCGYLMLRQRLDKRYIVPFNPQLWVIMLVFLLLGLVGVFGQQVGNAAHFSGLLVGFLLALLKQA